MAKKQKPEDLSSYDAIKKAFIKRCEDLSHVRSFPTPALCTELWHNRLKSNQESSWL